MDPGGGVVRRRVRVVRAVLGVPKPVQAHIPLIIGAGGGPKTFAWIAAHADGWMTTPTQSDISGQIEALKTAWADAGRDGDPGHPGADRLPSPDPDDLIAWAEAGATELIWGVPDKSEDEVLAYLDKPRVRARLTRRLTAVTWR